MSASAAVTRIPVATVEELQERKRLVVEAKGIKIGVFWVKGRYYAYRNLCPHAAAPVCEGPVCGTRLPSNVYEYIQGRDDEILRCPWHGWEFDLETGKHLAGESLKLRGYETAVEDGWVYVVM